MTFDPLNILLLAVALVVFWRLRSVLGSRTGTEKPPIDPFEVKQSGAAQGRDAGGNVLRYPSPGTSTDDAARDPQPAQPVWKGYAEEGSALAAALEQMAASDPSFTPRAFLDGAKVAYEMILDAFAKGDKAALKPLLSKDVFDGFSRVIDARAVEGHRAEWRFVGLDGAVIRQASLQGRKASITVAFESELISATYDKSGAVIEGDPKEIRNVSDVWTFEREVSSRNPNWKLAATQAQA